jgi:putative DNA primase/helicase
MAAPGAIPFSPVKPSRRPDDAPQRDVLIDLALARLDLWHSEDGAPMASVMGGETDAGEKAFSGSFPIRSKHLKSWLAHAHYGLTKRAAGAQATEDALRVLEGIAIHEGPTERAFVRLAGVGGPGGPIYVDLGDETHRAVEITRDGWRLVDRHGVRFVRPSGLVPFPVPRPEGSIDELADFINVSSADFPLVAGWMVGALRPSGPYPILVLTGEQGSAKSTAARVIRSLVDPNASPIRTMPREERDLVIAARNAHALCFDNISDMPAWLSDALCRIATGGGFATRAMYTDFDEILIDVSRPVILNGITNFMTRPDLADRAMILHLPAISDGGRRYESEILAEFEAVRPFLLGALFDAVAAALAGLDAVDLPEPPRMADFARWVVSAEGHGALPWSPGEFMGAYDKNRRGATEATAHDDIIASAIITLIDDVVAGSWAAPVDSPPGCWLGSASDLLEALRNRAPDYIKSSRSFPAAPNALGNRLKRMAPVLRAVGVMVEATKSGTRKWQITKDG